MDDTYIVTVFVVVDDILKKYGYEDDVRCQCSAAEIMTVAIVSASYFHNHHERALCLLTRLGFVCRLSVSRFNRRLHALSDWLVNILSILSEVFIHSEVFLIDSMPLPVCKRVRARRCGKVRGKEYCGYCAAKREKFFGWRLHLICTLEGIPVSFDMLPAAAHDLTPVHELASVLPEDASLFGDKGYLSSPDAETLLTEGHVRLVTPKRVNMTPNSWADDYDLRIYRKRIETVYSQLENMGTQHLHARTNLGFDLKVYASLLALTFSHFIN